MQAIASLDSESAEQLIAVIHRWLENRPQPAELKKPAGLSRKCMACGNLLPESNAMGWCAACTKRKLGGS